MIDRAIGYIWLARGLKYQSSRWVSDWRNPGAWDLPFSAAIRNKEISLNSISDLRGVVDALLPHVHYKWDPLGGAIDYITPPVTTLANGYADCDDAAMISACAVKYALKGWKARIVSYLTGPDWRLSHHVCAAVSPTGEIFAIQPYPEPGKQTDPLSGYAFKSFEHLATTGASWYVDNVKVQGFDVRTQNWEVIDGGRWTWLN